MDRLGAIFVERVATRRRGTCDLRRRESDVGVADPAFGAVGIETSSIGAPLAPGRTMVDVAPNPSRAPRRRKELAPSLRRGTTARRETRAKKEPGFADVSSANPE
jgi:hypothetical protein